MKRNLLFWSVRRGLAGDRCVRELIDDAGWRIALWELSGLLV